MKLVEELPEKLKGILARPLLLYNFSLGLWEPYAEVGCTPVIRGEEGEGKRNEYRKGIGRWLNKRVLRLHLLLQREGVNKSGVWRFTFPNWRARSTTS